MNVRTLCLSILQHREATGYEIRKLCVEGECSYFVEASYGSIYPALARMESEGLVTSRVEHQAGKPSKKLYAITKAGRTAFVEALKEPLSPDVYRSPFLMVARFAHLLDRDLVQTRLAEQLERLESDIGELKRLQTEGTGKSGGCGTSANDEWVLGYGIRCLEVARDELRNNMETLLASARQEAAQPARAAE